MNKCLAMLSLVLFISFIVQSSSGQQKKKTIAVLNFVNSGGVDKNEISILTDRFNNYLVNADVYDVLEREKMENILKEQDFTMTDNCNSSECAVQVGQLLGMEYMVAGKIGKFGDLYTIDIRIIDVFTGKILKTKSEDYEGKKEGLLGMIQRMAFTISGKTADDNVSGQTTGGDMVIGAVTQKFGSLEITNEIDGTLYIDDKKISDISQGSLIPIDKIRIGDHTVRIVYDDGEFKEEINIRENKKTSLTARKKSMAVLSGAKEEGNYIEGNNAYKKIKNGFSENDTLVFDDFSSGQLNSLWSSTITGCAGINANAKESLLGLYTGTYGKCSGSVNVISRKQFSVNDGIVVFEGRFQPYEDNNYAYGDKQPRGLAAGTNRNNAIEFISATGSSVTARTVENGVATETVYPLGSSVNNMRTYTIVAKPWEVKFYLEGKLIATHTANIPKVPLNVYFGSNYSSAANVPITADYVTFHLKKLTRKRGR